MRKSIFNWLLPSIYFNLRYFAFKDAIKLPVYVYNTKLLHLGGSVEIVSNQLSRGMIKIGFPETSLHSGDKYAIEISGKLRFHGPCHLGEGGVLSIGPKGIMDLGSNTIVSDGSRLICFHYFSFGNNSTAGWDCTFCDTDFHAMKNAFTEKKIKAYAPIKIGENNWVGSSCIVLKGTVTPNYTTMSSGSVLSKRYKCIEKSIISGNPAEVVSEGCFYRDMNDDKFEYQLYEK